MVSKPETSTLRTITVRDGQGKETQQLDLWQFVPESEISRELGEYFLKNPKVDCVWVVPCQYHDGDKEWTCQTCVEFPYSNAQRRLYGRSYRRIQ